MSISGLSCIFPSPDIKKTSGFYVSKLGFRAVEYLECAEPHICLYRDDIEIILLQANTDHVIPNRTLYGYGYDAYLYTGNQEFLEHWHDLLQELFRCDWVEVSTAEQAKDGADIVADNSAVLSEILITDNWTNQLG